MEFKDNLKMLREQSMQSQEELAKALNISTTSISHYETGRRQPSIDTLKQMALLFDVTLDRLLGQTNHNVSPSTMRQQYIKNVTMENIVERINKFDPQHRQLLLKMIECVEADMILSSRKK